MWKFYTALMHRLNRGNCWYCWVHRGCGKSTLLNAIAGLEDITSGEIIIDGRDVSNVAPKDRNIAMVFQSYALYPNMNVRQNITFGMQVRGVPKAEQQQRLMNAAKTLKIEELLHRKPGQLSGGQRQRVAMGRALVSKPTLFLFDEPLSNLDAKLRVEMCAEIKKTAQSHECVDCICNPRPSGSHVAGYQSCPDVGWTHSTTW